MTTTSETLPRVVLDACVLANHFVCDTLLRLAEQPPLYEPRWSDEIMSETLRTLEYKLGWPRSLVRYFGSEVRVNFPEAWVNGYERWIPKMTNDSKDRHVVAVAVASDTPTIVTFNLRHFKPLDLAPWYVTAVHPQQFLIDQFERHGGIVRTKLEQQAAKRKKSLTTLLNTLRKSVPEFVISSNPDSFVGEPTALYSRRHFLQLLDAEEIRTMIALRFPLPIAPRAAPWRFTVRSRSALPVKNALS